MLERARQRYRQQFSVEVLRERFTRKLPWTGVEAIVREARAAGPSIAAQPAGGAGTDPALAAERR